MSDPKHKRKLFPAAFARQVQVSPTPRVPTETDDDDDFDSADEDEEPLEFQDASPSKYHLLNHAKEHELTAKHVSTVEELAAKHACTANDLTAKHVSTVEELTAKHESTTNDLTAKHVSIVNDLTGQHASTVNDLTAKHVSTVEELEMHHMAEKVELTAAFNRDFEEAIECATEAAAIAAAAHAAEMAELEEAERALIEAAGEEFSKVVEASEKDVATLHSELETTRENLRSEQEELHKSKAECTRWQAWSAKHERKAAQLKAEVEDVQAKRAMEAQTAEEQLNARTEQLLDEQASNQKIGREIGHLEKELAALSAARSMVDAVWLKLGDGDEDDVLELEELDELVDKEVISDAPVALKRLREYLQQEEGEDGEPLEEQMVVEDFIVWWERNPVDRLELFGELTDTIKEEWSGDDKRTKQHADEDATLRELEANGGTLAIYMPTGKKKHDRFFQVCSDDCSITWGKKKVGGDAIGSPVKGNSPLKRTSNGPKKKEQVVSFEPHPAVKDARQWFERFDHTKSGYLVKQDLVELYQVAREEKLSAKHLTTAMAEMDNSGDGKISVDEFTKWWSDHGGDLEKYKELALTVRLKGGTDLLLLAPDQANWHRWVDGLRAMLRATQTAAASG